MNKKLIEWLRHCHQILRHPAHQAERPLHFAYFLAVGYYSGGVYGVLAICCGVVTVVSWGEHDA